MPGTFPAHLKTDTAMWTLYCVFHTWIILNCSGTVYSQLTTWNHILPNPGVGWGEGGVGGGEGVGRTERELTNERPWPDHEIWGPMGGLKKIAWGGDNIQDTYKIQMDALTIRLNWPIWRNRPSGPTFSVFSRIFPGFSQDFPRIFPGHSQDYTRTFQGLYQDFLQNFIWENMLEQSSAINWN